MDGGARLQCGGMRDISYVVCVCINNIKFKRLDRRRVKNIAVLYENEIKNVSIYCGDVRTYSKLHSVGSAIVQNIRNQKRKRPLDAFIDAHFSNELVMVDARLFYNGSFLDCGRGDKYDYKCRIIGLVFLL